jgi:predicted RNA-binding Zn-ribbon protein involved in translation (DUF1610 family)
MPWGLPDLVSLMDRWAVWKEVRANADRVPALEQRITALEERLQRAPGEACPKCGALSYRVDYSEQHRTFVGTRIHHMKCQDCGFTDEKMILPKK